MLEMGLYNGLLASTQKSESDFLPVGHQALLVCWWENIPLNHPPANPISPCARKTHLLLTSESFANRSIRAISKIVIPLAR